MGQSQFAFDLLTPALFTFDPLVLLAHGADDFELFLAGLANIFVDGHVTPVHGFFVLG